MNYKRQYPYGQEVPYNVNLPMEFNSGFYSRIRGQGFGYMPHKIFPGIQQIGNESGANDSIYLSKPDVGPVIQITRRYTGNNNAHQLTYIQPYPDMRL